MIETVLADSSLIPETSRGDFLAGSVVGQVEATLTSNTTKVVQCAAVGDIAVVVDKLKRLIADTACV